MIVYNIVMARLKHGMSCTPEHGAWKNMRLRCNNPKNRSYKNYGGRGIKVCEEWENNFSSFLNHIGLKPNRNLSLERIDNDKNYEPGNVKWATSKEQIKNQRKRQFRGKYCCSFCHIQGHNTATCEKYTEYLLENYGKSSL